MKTLNTEQLNQVIEKTLLIDEIDNFIKTLDQESIIYNILKGNDLKDMIKNIEKDKIKDQLKDCLSSTQESINEYLPEYDLYDCGTVSPIKILAMIEKNGANLRPLTSTIEINLDNQRDELKDELLETLKENKIYTSSHLEQSLRKNETDYILTKNIINIINDLINEC